MKKFYLIKLKNGDIKKIDDEQYKKISTLLTSAKSPKFIIVDDEVLSVDYIASIKQETW